MDTAWDIVGLGCVAVDDLLYVPAYPGADAKIQVRRRERQCGGLTATALVSAARLGMRCAYAGALGDDELSRFVRQRLREENIDTSLIRDRPHVRPIHSLIVVDECRQTRNIFFDLEGVTGAEPGWPNAEIIRASRVLFVDHFGIEGMTWAARIARSAGVAVVADLECGEWPGFEALLESVDHLIVSRDFALQWTGLTNPAAAAVRLWSRERQIVVVTAGADGCWYVAPSHPTQPRHQPAFPITVVDTTGCGDVFHGAYAAALVRQLDIPERIRYAAAAAALKATRCGGQAGAPTHTAVEAFLREHSS
jgi:sulfofructose kinase